MSAILITDKGEDWFTNSYTWLTILERAFDALPPELHDEYSGYANPVGADFEVIPGEARSAVARWLLQAVEVFLGPAGVEHGWDREGSRTHLERLAAMLRAMADA